MFRWRWAAVVAALLTAGALHAESPKAPATVKGKTGRTIRVSIDGKDGKTLVVKPAFLQGDDVIFDELVSPKPTQRRVFLEAYAPGAYPILSWYKGEDEDAVLTVITVEADKPPPAPPVPPTPTPTPTPDVPAPIPGDGLRALVVYDATTLTQLPAAQQAAIFSADVRAYLNQTCPAGADGKTREWRMWPKDADASGESATWQAAFKRDRKSLPWVVVSNGKTGFEGPLPATAADLLALLKKYGG